MLAQLFYQRPAGKSGEPIQLPREPAQSEGTTTAHSVCVQSRSRESIVQSSLRRHKLSSYSFLFLQKAFITNHSRTLLNSLPLIKDCPTLLSENDTLQIHDRTLVFRYNPQALPAFHEHNSTDEEAEKTPKRRTDLGSAETPACIIENTTSEANKLEQATPSYLKQTLSSARKSLKSSPKGTPKRGAADEGSVRKKSRLNEVFGNAVEPMPDVAQTRVKAVSFGPVLTPETFDKEARVMTPLTRGRNVSCASVDGRGVLKMTETPILLHPTTETVDEDNDIGYEGDGIVLHERADGTVDVDEAVNVVVECVVSESGFASVVEVMTTDQPAIQDELRSSYVVDIDTETIEKDVEEVAIMCGGTDIDLMFPAIAQTPVKDLFNAPAPRLHPRVNKRTLLEALINITETPQAATVVTPHVATPHPFPSSTMPPPPAFIQTPLLKSPARRPRPDMTNSLSKTSSVIIKPDEPVMRSPTKRFNNETRMFAMGYPQTQVKPIVPFALEANRRASSATFHLNPATFGTLAPIKDDGVLVSSDFIVGGDVLSPCRDGAAEACVDLRVLAATPLREVVCVSVDTVETPFKDLNPLNGDVSMAATVVKKSAKLAGTDIKTRKSMSVAIGSKMTPLSKLKKKVSEDAASDLLSDQLEMDSMRIASQTYLDSCKSMSMMSDVRETETPMKSSVFDVADVQLTAQDMIQLEDTNEPFEFTVKSKHAFKDQKVYRRNSVHAGKTPVQGVKAVHTVHATQPNQKWVTTMSKIQQKRNDVDVEGGDVEKVNNDSPIVMMPGKSKKVDRKSMASAAIQEPEEVDNVMEIQDEEMQETFEAVVAVKKGRKKSKAAESVAEVESIVDPIENVIEAPKKKPGRPKKVVVTVVEDASESMESVQELVAKRIRNKKATVEPVIESMTPKRKRGVVEDVEEIVAEPVAKAKRAKAVQPVPEPEVVVKEKKTRVKKAIVDVESEQEVVVKKATRGKAVEHVEESVVEVKKGRKIKTDVAISESIKKNKTTKAAIEPVVEVSVEPAKTQRKTKAELPEVTLAAPRATRKKMEELGEQENVPEKKARAAKKSVKADEGLGGVKVIEKKAVFEDVVRKSSRLA